MKGSTILVFAIAVISAACTSVKNAVDGRIALTNVTVVDVINSKMIPGQTIIIEDNKIIEVSPANSVKTGKSTRVIEASGKYVIPGLWDMHVHLEMASKKSLPHFIGYGVTGVRDMGANAFDTIKYWRNEIERGVLVGPRIVSPGPIIDGPFFVNELRVTVNSAAEARKAVDSLAALGVDFIKVHQQISKDAYLALAEQSAKNKLSFFGHKPAALTTKQIVEAGQRSIEHIMSTPDLDERTLIQMKMRNVFFTPNLLIVDKISRYHSLSASNDDAPLKISPILQFHWKKQVEAWGDNIDNTIAYMQNAMPELKRQTRTLQSAGIPLLAGTDLGIPFAYPGISLHEELELLVSAGLTPFEALQCATINPARFFKKDDEFGSIKKGKRADLILLDANPIENISNTRRINTVIVNGKIFDRKSLDALLK